METIEVRIERKGLEMDIDRESFALELKTWRIRKGYTQEEAGKLLGCSRYVIIDCEKAKSISWRMAYRVFARLAEQIRKEVTP